MMKVVAWAVGIDVLAQVVLVVAKLTGHIAWGWALTLIPVEALAVAVLVCVVLVLWMAASWGGLDFEDNDGCGRSE